MASSMEWSPRAESKAGFAAKIEVCRYDIDAITTKGRYEVLPNIQCDQIQYREGANPPTARFRYVLDDRARSMGWPSQFEEIIRLHGKVAADGEKPERAERYVVKTDDRIVVLCYDQTDSRARPSVLFDGFAQSPQVDVSGKGQVVTFVAAGVAVRCWDSPIFEALWRHADAPDDADNDDNHKLMERVLFNPSGPTARPGDGKALSGNATPDSVDDPAFIDPLYKKDHQPDEDGPVAWSLDKFARFLLKSYNKHQRVGDLMIRWVDNPDFDVLKNLLRSRTPKEDSEFFDPSDDSTYNEEEILVPEYDATGKPWPEVLASVLEHHGFAMAFRCSTDENGEPWDHLEIYRKDGSGPFDPKTIPFQRAGGRLNTAEHAIGAASVTRDYASAFNSVVGLTRPTLIELSVVLAPAFQIKRGPVPSDQEILLDYGMAAIAEDPAKAENRLMYRLWVCEEVGGKITQLDDNRWYEDDAMTDAKRLYTGRMFSGSTVRRRLPGRAHLVTRNPNNEADRMKATLAVSTDYEGEINDTWDGTGKWRTVAPGHGWRLLEDRLGVYLTCENPNAWNIGDGEQPKLIKLVSTMLNPSENNKPVFLRLTTVIEDPGGISRKISSTLSSPLKFPRTRMIDVGETRREIVHRSSPNFDEAVEQSGREPTDDGWLVVVRNDGPFMEKYMKQVIQTHKDPPIAGSVTIPWISEAYQIGDQISEISGRGLSLQTNAGAEQGEAPRYPYVIGVDWGFANGQSTTLHLSDRRAEPRPRW